MAPTAELRVGCGALPVDLWWPILGRMEPTYISIEMAARLANRSRSSVKRWIKACRDLIDAGQKPLFDFIDPPDGQHGRVDIHRESFLEFRASKHRTRGQEKPSQDKWIMVLYPPVLPVGFDSARDTRPVVQQAMVQVQGRAHRHM
jgi:hypothetical protein